MSRGSRPFRSRACALAARGLAALLALAATGAQGLEVRGYLGAEARGFAHRPKLPGQRHDDLSVVLRPEFHHAWNGGEDSVLLTPFVRLDSSDARRSHVDLREALYQHVRQRWELRAGLGVVFWGAAESRHLVDVINQVDLVEDLDGEDRLGQPMVALAFERDWGLLDLYLLPGFRERTFPGRRGRLRAAPEVDTDRAVYESAAGRGHVDVAARWSRVLGGFDLGLAHFHGTAREPRLVAGTDGAGNPVLVPHYDLVHRVSLDLQGAAGAWLWKLEAVYQAGSGPAHVAWVGGFEHTRHGIAGTDADLGLLVEHLFDGRGSQATQPFENDLFLGLRLALNDAHGSTLLAGVVHDLGGQGDVLTLEASRRLGGRWRVELEARAWSGMARTDPRRPLARDDHVLLRVLRYF